MAQDLTAVVFPGQGSQHDEMRAKVEREAPDLLERTLELTGCDPFERLDEGTEYVQPAVYAASVASWRRLREELPVAAVAGHSLGELAALVASGALSEEDGLRLAVERGRLTQRVARAAHGGMLAVMGAPADALAPIADRAEVHLANDNSPRQVVLSGLEEGLRRCAELSDARGLKARRLAVDGPFHSPLMRPAVAPFARAVARARLAAPSLRVLSSVTARPFDGAARLTQALVAPVRWRSTVERLHASGVRRFVEASPGRVLSGLVRRTLPDAETLHADALHARAESAR